MHRLLCALEKSQMENKYPAMYRKEIFCQSKDRNGETTELHKNYKGKSCVFF